MNVKISRSELLKSKGTIKIETPDLVSLPLDEDLSKILSLAIQKRIAKEPDNDERVD